MNQEFLKPRLDGVRFNEHSIPLELLKDLATKYSHWPRGGTSRRHRVADQQA